MHLKRVAILGANGQVGSELALLMSLSKTIKPIAVARSSYSLALLKKLGIECFVAKNNNELKNVLRGCNAAIELVHPKHENIRKMEGMIIDRCKIINSSLPKDASIVYCSTKSIFTETNLSEFQIYGYTKLFAEKQFRKISKKNNRKVCILRLGEVHGAMQNCTQTLMSLIKNYKSVRVPDISSNSVFVSSIEETINKFINGELSEDTYTMISSPAWSYGELINWIANEANTPTNILFVKKPNEKKLSLIFPIKEKIKLFINNNKDLLKFVLSKYFPFLQIYLKKQYLCSRIKSMYSQYQEQITPLLYDQYFQCPGKRVPGLSDSRITMPPKYKKTKEILSNLLK